MKRSLLNILAPIDFSEAEKSALRVAIDFCRQHNAVLHLLYVMESRYIITGSPRDVNTFEISHTINERARTCMYEKYETILKEYKLAVQIHMPSGMPYDEICSAADEIPTDLIVMGTRGISGAKNSSAGSATAGVIKNSTRSVLIVPAYFEAAVFREILFPVRPVKGVIDKYQFIQSFLREVKSSVHIANLYLQSEVEERLIYNDNEQLFAMMPANNSANLTYLKKLYVCSNFATKVLELSKVFPIDFIIINSWLDYKGLDFSPGSYIQQIINLANIPVLSFPKEFNLFRKTRQINNLKLHPFNK